jgi:hypothetical protein
MLRHGEHILEVLLEAILIANGRSPCCGMHQIHDLRRGLHGMCGRKLHPQLLGEVKFCPLDHSLPDVPKRFVEVGATSPEDGFGLG